MIKLSLCCVKKKGRGRVFGTLFKFKQTNCCAVIQLPVSCCLQGAPPPPLLSSCPRILSESAKTWLLGLQQIGKQCGKKRRTKELSLKKEDKLGHSNFTACKREDRESNRSNKLAKTRCGFVLVRFILELKLEKGYGMTFDSNDFIVIS